MKIIIIETIFLFISVFLSYILWSKFQTRKLKRTLKIIKIRSKLNKIISKVNNCYLNRKYKCTDKYHDVLLLFINNTVYKKRHYSFRGIIFYFLYPFMRKRYEKRANEFIKDLDKRDKRLQELLIEFLTEHDKLIKYQNPIYYRVDKFYFFVIKLCNRSKSKKISSVKIRHAIWDNEIITNYIIA